jgi:opacity protein-like surface antigen
MKNVLSALCAGTLAAAMSISAQVVDPSDAVIYAPLLSAEQIAQFQMDGTASPFWETGWTGDYSEMTIMGHSHPERATWNGETDAVLTVKIAAGPEGIYLYCKVTDDVWVTGPTWHFDAVDLMLDSKSPADIANATDRAAPQFEWCLTQTSKQYQVWMGGPGEVATGLMFNQYDPTYFTWWEAPKSFAEMVPEGGVQMEVFIIDEQNKAQEWFVPWAHLGMTDQIAEGQQISFAGGYNDMDVTDITLEPVSSLRLKQYDPIGGAAGTTFADRAQYWGAVVLPALQVGVNNPFATKGIATSADVRATEFYTLQGKKLNAASRAAIAGHSVVIQRNIMADGSVRSERIRLSK